MKIKKYINLCVGGLILLVCKSAFAICPICTIAVGAGVGLAQWLGIDDTITGLWVGGLTVSVILWTLNWFKSKNIKFFADKLIVTVGYYAFVVAPLYYHKLFGHLLNRLWGIDKLLLGIVVGSIFFWLAATCYEWLKAKNGGHANFPFQKVVMPIGTLLVLSGIFYLLTR